MLTEHQNHVRYDSRLRKKYEELDKFGPCLHDVYILTIQIQQKWLSAIYIWKKTREKDFL